MTPDERAARLARRQRGRITTQQLRDAGLSEREIRVRKNKGLLIVEHRGVYAYASAPPVPFGKEHAALLACGDEAKLSHRSAGALRRINSLAAVVDVTLPPGRNRERRGVIVHQRHLERHEWMIVDGLKVTTPLRTLHDLAEVLTVDQLRRAINEAYVLGLVQPGQLHPKPGARGAATMRAALQESQVTKSHVERRFHRLVQQSGLRAADDTNVDIAGYNVDALWIKERVAVEIDVFSTHAGAAKFETDHRKDLALRAERLTPCRYTESMIDDTPLKVVADLAKALAG